MPIVVPFSRSAIPRPTGSLRDPPPEPWALMAVAQMHSEGRLIPGQSANPVSLTNERSSQAPNNP